MCSTFSVNRILELFRNHFSDIAWFQAFLPHFNGTTKFNKSGVGGGVPLCLDASLTGIGAIGIFEYTSLLSPPSLGLLQKIIHLEMWNIVIALRLWGNLWKHSLVVNHCDNEVCVYVIATKRTKDPFLALCIRNLWLITAFYDISLQLQYIRGKNNAQADTLSRLHSNKPINQNILQDLVDNYAWDKVLPHHFHLDVCI